MMWWTPGDMNVSGGIFLKTAQPLQHDVAEAFSFLKEFVMQIQFKGPDGKDVVWTVKKPGTGTMGVFSQWCEEQATRSLEKMYGTIGFDQAVENVRQKLEMRLYDWGEPECAKHLEFKANRLPSLGQKRFCEILLGEHNQSTFNQAAFNHAWDLLEKVSYKGKEVELYIKRHQIINAVFYAALGVLFYSNELFRPVGIDPTVQPEEGKESPEPAEKVA